MHLFLQSNPAWHYRAIGDQVNMHLRTAPATDAYSQTAGISQRLINKKQ